METSPTSPFIVAKPQFLLQILIVALDAPAHMRLSHEFIEGNVFG